MIDEIMNRGGFRSVNFVFSANYVAVARHLMEQGCSDSGLIKAILSALEAPVSMGLISHDEFNELAHYHVGATGSHEAKIASEVHQNYEQYRAALS